MIFGDGGAALVIGRPAPGRPAARGKTPLKTYAERGPRSSECPNSDPLGRQTRVAAISPCTSAVKGAGQRYLVSLGGGEQRDRERPPRVGADRLRRTASRLDSLPQQGQQRTMISATGTQRAGLQPSSSFYFKVEGWATCRQRSIPIRGSRRRARRGDHPGGAGIREGFGAGAVGGLRGDAPSLGGSSGRVVLEAWPRDPSRRGGRPAAAATSDDIAPPAVSRPMGQPAPPAQDSASTGLRQHKLRPAQPPPAQLRELAFGFRGRGRFVKPGARAIAD